ncbi:MAG TPA: protein YgfX [Rhodanobacteraceae bacterium]|jgi:toxin CptA|nr:protein YgfX [Rhodanobacteraceae bacterium]
MKSAPAVGFDYHASRSLILATLVVAFFAVAAVWLSGLPWLAQLALTLGIVAAAGVAFGNLVRPRVRSMRWRSDGGADICLGDDRREAQGEVSAARVMGPLIALSLRWPPRGRATLWLLPDNLDPETRRRLRMRLGAVAAHPLSGNTDNA